MRYLNYASNMSVFTSRAYTSKSQTDHIFNEIVSISVNINRSNKNQWNLIKLKSIIFIFLLAKY